MTTADLKYGDRIAATFGSDALIWHVEAVNPGLVLLRSGCSLREIWNDEDLARHRAIKLDVAETKQSLLAPLVLMNLSISPQAETERAKVYLQRCGFNLTGGRVVEDRPIGGGIVIRIYTREDDQFVQRGAITFDSFSRYPRFQYTIGDRAPTHPDPKDVRAD